MNDSQSSQTDPPSTIAESGSARFFDPFEQLRQTRLWAGLPEGLLKTVAGFMHGARFRPEEKILRQGEVSSRLHVIMWGKVEVFMQVPGNLPIPLAQLKAGEVFGEMALLSGDPASADVTAIEDTGTFTLDRGAFNALVTQYPELLFRNQESWSTCSNLCKLPYEEPCA